MNSFQSMDQNTTISPPTVTKFYLVREHLLHGIVTGIEGVRIMSALEDKLDRLLVSFKDAKVRRRKLFASGDRLCFSSPRSRSWSGPLRYMTW
jgi:hypothetical protein